jgi:hypothetical protein
MCHFNGYDDRNSLEGNGVDFGRDWFASAIYIYFEAERFSPRKDSRITCLVISSSNLH